MAHLTNPAEWRPTGISELEEAAWEVLRSWSNKVVIAGPGAGKTELLAQRACYLLQTGIVRSGRRILAISYKRDAAKNLKDRVGQRCDAEDAVRFDSLTFDAFSKGLLDRFYPALAESWKPSADYEILLRPLQTFRDFLDKLGQPRWSNFERDAVVGRSPKGLVTLTIQWHMPLQRVGGESAWRHPLKTLTIQWHMPLQSGGRRVCVEASAQTHLPYDWSTYGVSHTH